MCGYSILNFGFSWFNPVLLGRHLHSLGLLGQLEMNGIVPRLTHGLSRE